MVASLYSFSKVSINYIACKLNSLILLVLHFLLSSHLLHATNYTSNGTDNWGTPGTWSPSGTPGSADNVTLAFNFR